MMGHPKCKTCKHFTETEGTDDWDNPRGFGRCNLIEMTCEMTEWDKDYTDLALKPQYREHLAGVMDASSYHAALHPQPDFYCPMHSDLMPSLCISQEGE